MPTFDGASLLIRNNVSTLGIERVPILDSLGRVLCDEFIAPWQMPQCNNSAMDGFAVRAEDCRDGALLPIAASIAAGSPVGTVLAPGTAARIMTGAAVPAYCDAVVPFEVAEELNGAVKAKAEVKPRQHIRFAGEDVAAGEVILTAGAVIRPAEISMLASFGQAAVAVYRRPIVAIVSTGDELVELGDPLEPGKIMNSNAFALAAAVREAGGVPNIIGIARDNRESHRQQFTKALQADAMITSAGVSTGDRDLVREVLAELGAREIFWRVDVQPGGPTAFAVHNGRPVFCLPGNPVAALLMFDAFVRPALLKMAGHTRFLKRPIKAVLQGVVKKKPGKMKLVRVRLELHDGLVQAFSSGDQNTGMLKTLVRSDGYAMLNAERADYSPGEIVDVQLLSDNINMLAEDDRATRESFRIQAAGNCS